MSIPALFRTALRTGSESGGMALVLRPSHRHPCIEGWSADGFQRLFQSFDKLDVFSPDQDDLATTFYAEAWPVEPDKEGRIVVPEYLVQHAGLTDAAVFMGLGRTFQIWEPAGAARRTADARHGVRDRGLTLPGASAP